MDYDRNLDEHFVIDSTTNIKYALNAFQYEEMCEYEQRAYGMDYRVKQDEYLSRLLSEGALNLTFWNNRL